VAAVDAIEPGQWSDPEVLSRIRSRAVDFSFNDGETKVVDLKLTAGS
jgi:hypothetical protein